MWRSTVACCDRIGVSTSITPCAEKKARTEARSSARALSVSSLALGRQLIDLFAGSRQVLAGARVDLEQLADLHEQRHAHDGAGLQRRRLAAAARGVAAQAR